MKRYLKFIIALIGIYVLTAILFRLIIYTAYPQDIYRYDTKSDELRNITPLESSIAGPSRLNTILAYYTFPVRHPEFLFRSRAMNHSGSQYGIIIKHLGALDPSIKSNVVTIIYKPKPAATMIYFGSNNTDLYSEPTSK